VPTRALKSFAAANPAAATACHPSPSQHVPPAHFPAAPSHSSADFRRASDIRCKRATRTTRGVEWFSNSPEPTSPNLRAAAAAAAAMGDG
jgi:hypothetical protein